MPPATIDDPQRVRDAFAQWVALQASAPADAAALIEQLELSHDYAGFLETEIDGRRLAWKCVSAYSRTRTTSPEINLGDVDVWTAESESLRRRSLHIANCDTCGGEKKVRCSACRGSGKQSCGVCNGQRKTYGHASNGAYRLLNCAECRGKGEVDCGYCRRGVAVCATCAGEGKLQRWLEVETWQRSTSHAHPPEIAAQWNADAITENAELASDVERPRALTIGDLETIPESWLELLKPELTAEERVTRQRLRIARVPQYRVHYRLGDDSDSVLFTGQRLLPPVSAGTNNAFDRRARRLRSLRLLLIAIAVVVTIASLARDAFFRSVTTYLSVLACNVALVVIGAVASDWTAARLHAPVRIAVATSLLIAAIALAVAASPRAAHARQALALGNLDDAEAEMRLLNAGAPASLWADLHLARIEHTEDLEMARGELAQIPRTFPQYRNAANGVARLATDLARTKIERADWSDAANAIVVAQKAGAGTTSLQPLCAAIESAAIDAAAKARRADKPDVRLKERLKAEEIFMSLQRAADGADAPQLIALRAAMAHDVAAVEHQHKH